MSYSGLDNEHAVQWLARCVSRSTNPTDPGYRLVSIQQLWTPRNPPTVRPVTHFTFLTKLTFLAILTKLTNVIILTSTTSR
jgi:hypothetical protein